MFARMVRTYSDISLFFLVNKVNVRIFFIVNLWSYQCCTCAIWRV